MPARTTTRQLETTARVFHALSDPTRLNLVALLRGGERCVCDLTDALEAGQSRLSFHLKTLKDAGLVLDRREGRWVYYRLNQAKVEELAGVLTDCCAPNRGWLQGGGGGEEVSSWRERGARATSGRLSARNTARPRSASSRARTPIAAAAAAVAAGKRARAPPTSTPIPSLPSCPKGRCWPRSAAATPPRSPSFARGRRCSTWEAAAASTCCSRRGGSGPPARCTAST